MSDLLFIFYIILCFFTGVSLLVFLCIFDYKCVMNGYYLRQIEIKQCRREIRQKEKLAKRQERLAKLKIKRVERLQTNIPNIS